jgi:hypothetical protein
VKVTNYNLSKKLAEIGFKAETKNWWMLSAFNEPTHRLKTYNCFEDYVGDNYRAYDFETIWNALPAEISNYEYLSATKKNPLVLILDKSNTHRPIYYTFSDVGGCYFGGRIQDRDCLADTAARLLITLVEEGIIKFK